MPEHLPSLVSALQSSSGPDVVCTTLAEIFGVRPSEVALLRLEQKSLRFVYPEHLRNTGAIPIDSPAVAAHTALSKTAEIFNNFAQVAHASIFEMIRPSGVEQDTPPRIQKLMSAPILDQKNATVLGVIQISRKGIEPRQVPDFAREEMYDLQFAADLLAKALFLQRFVCS